MTKADPMARTDVVPWPGTATDRVPALAAGVAAVGAVTAADVAAVQSVTVDTPAGAFTALVGAGGVVASGFTAEADELRRLLPAALRDIVVVAGERGAADAAGVTAGDAAGVTPGDAAGVTAALTAAVTAYVAGDLTALDRVPVAAGGTAFQQRAWAALRALRPGAPITYAQLAARAGSPRAARAAGSACARNPTALVVPCHRVVRGDGVIGGFAWGVDAKRWLLDHERRYARASAP